MNANEKVLELRNKIESTLLPLIKNNYYLLEVPYYNNIGDTLIWQGEMDFLKKIHYKCKGVFSADTFRYPCIKESDLLLLQGGGNFGDLYPFNHDFKMEVVKRYPKNKVIIFPQTIWFEKHENLIKCASFLSEHLNVIICARDQVSYDVFKKYFKNEILLLPDMAFCIDIKKWDIKDKGGMNLLLKRNDGELKSNSLMTNIETDHNTHVTDWPTMLDKEDFTTKCLKHFKSLRYRYNISPFYFFCDFYAQNVYRKHLINSGVKILRNHNKIYTTRLHTAILSVLLAKSEIGFFDNSYGKNKNFYDTWLADCDNIQLIHND